VFAGSQVMKFDDVMLKVHIFTSGDALR
jgi:hypothetical protein